MKKIEFSIDNIAALFLFRKDLIKYCSTKNECFISSLNLNRELKNYILGYFPKCKVNSYISFFSIFQKVDLVISFGIRGIIVSSFFRPFTKSVWILSGVGSVFRGKPFFKLKLIRALFSLIVFMRQKNINEIIVLNHSDRNLLHTRYKQLKNKIRIIKAEGFQSKNYKPNNLINISYVGRITYDKGFDLFVDAIKKIVQKYHRKICIFIIGSEYKNNPSAMTIKDASDIEIVHISRYNQQYAPNIYNLMDIIVLPSRFEGMPFSLLEALLTTKEIIISTSPGHYDLNDELSNLKNIKWFENGNLNSLANTLDELILHKISRTDKRDNLDNDRVSFIRTFEFDSTIKDWEKMWSDEEN